MTAHNTDRRYGSVAKTFHWLTALLVISAIALGIIANDMAYDTGDQLARKAWLFSLHKTVGVTVFFVALARIAWAFGQPKPAGLHPDRRAESFLAELVHWLLYGSLVLVPLTGWIHHAATTGFAPIWWPFGQNLPFVPKSETLAGVTAGLHIVFERVLMLSVLLHIAGALKHHFVDRDDTLRRMLPGHTEAGIPPHISSIAPPLTALVVWAAALGIGSALGAYSSHSTHAAAATELEAVQSDWTVQNGTIGLTVTQFGSAVDGQFGEWTAQITFDADAPATNKGSVRTVIAIDSLSLGSVTDQAMGADFFAVSEHPTAVFDAQIREAGDSYEAVGTLTIKETSLPVTLPFTLEISGETAQMNGALTLNRLDFGIGANMPDEGSLAFAVDVQIALTAIRAD